MVPAFVVFCIAPRSVSTIIVLHVLLTCCFFISPVPASRAVQHNSPVRKIGGAQSSQTQDIYPRPVLSKQEGSDGGRSSSPPYPFRGSILSPPPPTGPRPIGNFSLGTIGSSRTSSPRGSLDSSPHRRDSCPRTYDDLDVGDALDLLDAKNVLFQLRKRSFLGMRKSSLLEKRIIPLALKVVRVVAG